MIDYICINPVDADNSFDLLVESANCASMTFTLPRLKDISAISAGYPLRGAVEALPSGHVAVLQMRNVDLERGIDWPNVARVSLPSGRSTNLLQPGDVIFTTRGARNFALALEELRSPAVCSPHFFVLRMIDQANAMPKFVAWQMNQRPAQEHFQREATGSYILNIRREVVENLPLVLPPIDLQRAIISFAEAASSERSTLAKLIENRNHQLEAIALGLHAQGRPKA